MEFTNTDQIKVEFKDGSEIIARINVVDGDKIQASALNKNEKYNEGDTIYLDTSQDKITKLNKRFQWAFDKHKPQYKYNPDTNVIEKEEENITKVGMKKYSKLVRWEDHPLYDYLKSGFENKKVGDTIESYPFGEGTITELRHSYESPDMLQGFMVDFDDKRTGNQFVSLKDCLVELSENQRDKKAIKTASQEQPAAIYVTKVLGEDWYQKDSISNQILESDLPDDQKKQKLMERAIQLLTDASVYDVLWKDSDPMLDKSNIIHNSDEEEPVQIDESEIDIIIQQHNEDSENWNEDNEMFETRSILSQMIKQSHELSGETRKEVDNTFNDIKRLISEYDETDDYNKLLEIKGILTSLLRIVEAEAKECMDSKSKEAK